MEYVLFFSIIECGFIVNCRCGLLNYSSNIILLITLRTARLNALRLTNFMLCGNFDSLECKISLVHRASVLH